MPKETEPWPGLEQKNGAAGRSWREVGRQGSVGMWYMKPDSCPGNHISRVFGRLKLHSLL